MADAAQADLLMKFVLKSKNGGIGGGVNSESVLDVIKSDPFMEGFKSADYDDYSNFFEVQTFDFSLNVKPKDESTTAPGPQGGPHAGPHGSPHVTQYTSGPAPAAKDQFSRWRSAKENEYSDIVYPIDFENFSFTRIIDSASPLFFQACCNQESFFSATLVKRVASVVTGDKVRKQLGYLRFDIHNVMLTSFSWNDGELITETCTFICEKMKARYRQQHANSALMPEVPPVKWDQNKHGKGSE